ncbi:MAG TPA: hypothetical protein VLX68_06300 [Chitinivibrionales bacterium]|nr:hypothetical protein [Chitinivibrionales bacterium]
MKRRLLKGLFLALFGTTCFLGLNFSLCGPTSPGTTSVPLSSLIITNQIAGWVSDSMDNFVDTSIYNYVDGGSSTYCGTCLNSTLKEGFQRFMFKAMSATDTGRVKMLVIEYGTAANSQTIFAGKVQGSSWEPESALAPYLISDAFYTNNGSSIYAYGHFSNFYIEMQFTKYTSSGLALPDASAFMNYFHSIIVQ